MLVIEILEVMEISGNIRKWNYALQKFGPHSVKPCLWKFLGYLGRPCSSGVGVRSSEVLDISISASPIFSVQMSEAPLMGTSVPRASKNSNIASRC